jgi:hypothetical protein
MIVGVALGGVHDVVDQHLYLSHEGLAWREWKSLDIRLGFTLQAHVSQYELAASTETRIRNDGMFADPV